MKGETKALLLLLCLFLVALICYQCDKAHGATFPETVLKVADSYSYVRELTNNNDAPAIDKFLAYQGLPKRLSWCLAFSVYCYHEAADHLKGIKMPLPKMARCSTFWYFTRARSLQYQTITRQEAVWGVYPLNPADVAIWSHSRVSGRDNWNGHAGLVVKPTKKGFRSIEGNTVCEDCPGDQREGGGVFYRTRSLAPGSFQVEGFVRPHITGGL